MTVSCLHVYLLINEYSMNPINDSHFVDFILIKKSIYEVIMCCIDFSQ